VAKASELTPDRRTFTAGPFERGFEVCLKGRGFYVDTRDRAAFDEVFSSRQPVAVREALRSHRASIEIRAFRLELPVRADVKIDQTYRQRQRAEQVARKRNLLACRSIDEDLCRLAAQFFEPRPVCIYVHRENCLYSTDGTTYGQLVLPTPPEPIDVETFEYRDLKPDPILRLTCPGGPVVEPVAGDARMDAAHRKARADWLRFVAAFGRREGEGYRVLVELKEAGRTELVWIDVSKAEGARVSGFLLSDCLTLRRVEGDGIVAEKSQVRDWVFTEKGKTEGGFVLALVEGKD
jgi:uncharacterized protein YegJ (DUF2314 family)